MKDSSYPSIRSWFLINKIKDGYVFFHQNKIIKVIEVIPINFKLKSLEEQKSILYQYHNFLKVINCDMQIIIQVKPTDVSKYKDKYIKIYDKEKDNKVKEMILDYINLIDGLAKNKKTISRRFFVIIFLKESKENKIEQKDILVELNKKLIEIKEYLFKCGNQVLEVSDYEYEKLIYSYLNRSLSDVEMICMKEELKQIIY